LMQMLRLMGYIVPPKGAVALAHHQPSSFARTLSSLGLR